VSSKRPDLPEVWKVGHFQSQCRTKTKSNNGSHKQSANSRRVNTVEVDNDDSNEYAFVIDGEYIPGGCVDVCIGGVVLHNVLIDSGATCNLVDKNTWEELKRQHIKCKSEKTTKKIYAYASRIALKTVGMFTALVQVGKHQTQAEFIVIDGVGKPILGRDTAMQLDVLRVGKSEKSQLNTVCENEYPNVFNGIGKLRDYQVRLHINPEVKPVAQSVRRIPLALRPKVEEEIQRLLEQDIIEPVQGPTPWVSPVVVVPKGSGVRLCVDMRQANEAIVRERHPIPTVDEVLEN